MTKNNPNQIITTVGDYYKMLEKFVVKNPDLKVKINLGQEPDDENKDYELHIFLDFKAFEPKITKPKKAKLYGLDGRELVH